MFYPMGMKLFQVPSLTRVQYMITKRFGEMPNREEQSFEKIPKTKARLLVSFCTYTLVILNKKETGVAGDPAPKNQTPYLFLYNRSSDQKIYYIKNTPYLWGLNLFPTLTVKSNQFRKSFYHVVSEKRGYVYMG